MELFRVTCVTCSARLSVRSAELLGQIVACPRCQSMVLVEPPADAAAAAPRTSRPAVDEAPATARGGGERQGDASATPREQAQPTAATPTESALADSSFEQVATFLSAAETEAAGEAAPHGGDALPATGQHALESAPEGGTWRPWLVGGGAGLAFGALTVGALLAGRASRGAPAAAPPAPLSAASEVATETGAAAAVSAAESPHGAAVADRGAASPPAASPAEDVSAAPEDRAAELPAREFARDGAPATGLPATGLPAKGLPAKGAAVGEASAAASAAPAAEAASPATVSDASAAATSATDEEPAAEPRVSDSRRLQVDPLDVDPEGMDWHVLNEDPVRRPIWAEAAASPPSVADAAAAEPAAAMAAEPGAAEGVDPAADEGLGQEAAVRRDPAGTPWGPLPPAAEQLAQPVASLQFEGLPLLRGLDLLGDLSGAPISVPPEELRLASVSAAQPARLDVRDTDVAGALRTLLEPLRLAAVVEGSEVVVQRIGLAERREVSYPIGDLVDASFTAEDLAEWIRESVEPSAWAGDEIVSQGDRLRIVHAERMQYAVLFFLERLRLCRGLPPKSKYPAKLLPPEAAESELRALLAQRAIFTFSRYSALSDIIRHWRDALGVEIVVDWASLAEIGLRPQTQIACRSVDQSWAAALDAVLLPLDADWRCVDGKTLQIAAREHLADRAVIAWYRVGVDQQPQLAAYREQVAEAVRAAGNRAAGSTVVRYDAPSGRLAVRQSAAVHRLLAAQWP